jgi:multidrug resistance efflux pump
MNAIDQAQGYSELLQLEQNRQSAALAIMQSVAARQAKQRDYQYQQYQQALEQQRNLMAYQRDVSSFVVNVQRVGVERNQLLTRLDEVETELEQASVFSPYAGVVRRVDVEQQSNDTLQARLVLDVEQ